MKKRVGLGLRKRLLGVTLIPILLFGIVIILCSCNRLAKSVHQEVESGLKNVAQSAAYIFEKEFPGEYRQDSGSTGIFKGGRKTEEAVEILETLKEISGADISIFYQDTRVVTTILNKENKPIVGFKANAVIIRDVYKGETERFYAETSINGQEYFAYYCPLYDSQKKCTGMIFAGKPSNYVSEIVLQGVLPIVTIIILAVLAMSVIMWQYSERLTVAMKNLQYFLMKVERGDFTAELGEVVEQRKDELGRIGKSAVQMQCALRELVEQDSLTKLYNRHYGEIWLRKVIEASAEKNSAFSVAIADIDFFKKFNDNYGHDCGDLVLRKVSNILRKNMKRQGCAARWGGEEFLLVFSDKGLEESLEETQRIADKIRRLRISYEDKELGVTVTIGIIEGDSRRNMDELIKAADQALYEGKESGRDRVQVGFVKVEAPLG